MAALHACVKCYELIRNRYISCPLVVNKRFAKVGCVVRSYSDLPDKRLSKSILYGFQVVPSKVITVG